jgi:CheY-like chemotaxis protein
MFNRADTIHRRGKRLHRRGFGDMNLTEDMQSAPKDSLRGKRIGLLACTKTMYTDFSEALTRVHASSAPIQAEVVPPGAPELDRYDALVLHVSDDNAGLDWFRAEVLRRNTRPLLLAGATEAVCGPTSWQSYVDDVILPPFSTPELLFRLHRLIVGASERRRNAEPRSKPCVLVADDDPAIILFVKFALLNFDVDAHFVRDGKAALDSARRLHPDLLLLDVGMPIMSGIEVLRSLRKFPGTSSLVTVMLTGSSDSSDVKNGFQLGAVDYILKPCKQVDLTRKLTELLNLNTGVLF